ncbi:MAG TPA: hypothetical protein VJ959_00605 [Desulfotignum sp.]|nr:hypothetical protein [Desulfotignum sp.]
MRNFPDTLVNIIKKSDLNINQISKISGISNTYLTKLLKHKINHPGKDKIASVLLALNFQITEINQVLADYDYQPLNHHDIPAILKNNRNRRFEGRIVPHFDYIYFELVMAALEALGGTKIIIKERPSGIFIPMDLYMMKEFPIESDDQAARFFMAFTHDVVAERKKLFLENCRKGNRFETYICQGCLEESLKNNIGTEARTASPRRADLFARYFANAVSAFLKFPDQHLHRVVKRCTYFQFQIQDAQGKNPKVSFTSDRRHYFHNEWEQLSIEGFLSNAPGITDLFFHEVEKCRTAARHTDDINTPEGFHDYIRSLFVFHGMGPAFDQALSQLMDIPGLTFH